MFIAVSGALYRQHLESDLAAGSGVAYAVSGLCAQKSRTDGALVVNMIDFRVDLVGAYDGILAVLVKGLIVHLYNGTDIDDAGFESGFVNNLCIFYKILKLGDTRFVFRLSVSCLVVFAVL